MPQQTPEPVRISIQSDAMNAQLQSLLQEQISTSAQIAHLRTERDILSHQGPGLPERARAISNAKIAELDRVLAVHEERLARVRESIAQTQQLPHAIVSETAPPFIVQDRGMFGMSKDEFTGVFALLIFFPFVITFARMLWRRDSRPAKTPLDTDRFARLEQAVESIAIEVERIGESQRFQTKLMTDREHDILPAETRK